MDKRLEQHIGFNSSSPINMCLGEVYCLKCGSKEYFNINNPYSRPNKCKKCGGELADKQTEEFMIKFKEEVNKLESCGRK